MRNDLVPLGAIQKKGLPKLVRDFFDDMFKREELPVSPYPDLVQRFRIAESAEGEPISIQERSLIAGTCGRHFQRTDCCASKRHLSRTTAYILLVARRLGVKHTLLLACIFSCVVGLEVDITIFCLVHR